MTSRARLAPALAALIALSSSPALARPAAADRDADQALADQAAWLDHDSPAVFRVEAGELERVVGLASSIGGEAGTAVALAALGGARYLGFDLLSARGWRAAGLDPDVPLLVQLAAIDSSATDRRYRELARRGGQFGTHGSDSPPLWRSRLVARATDPASLRAAVAGAALLDRATPVDDDHAAAVAELLAATRPRSLIRDLSRRKVTLVATISSQGALVFLRQDGALVALDVVAPFAGDALEWPRDRRALLAVLDRPAGALPPRAVAALAGPGLVAWTAPLGLHDVSQAERETELLRARIVDGNTGELKNAPRGCARLRSLAKATLTDLALRLHLASDRITVEARYGHRGALASALAADDQGLFVDDVTDGDAHLVIRLAGLAGLRALPRPALLSTGWDDAWAITRWCESGAEPLAWLFAWPELAGLWLDEVVLALPAADALIAGVGNLGLVVASAAAARVDSVAVAIASLDTSALTPARAVLDQVFGDRRHHRRPRPYSAWGAGPLRPYILEGSAGGRSEVGAGFGRSLSWRLGQPGAATGKADRPLVEAGGRADHLLVAVFSDGPWASLARLIARHLGAFQLTATTTDSELTATLTIALP